MRPPLGLLLCAALCACANPQRVFKPADPLTAEDHFRLGSAYEANGLPDDAAKQYQRSARLNPSNPEIWMALGNIHFKYGEYSRAEDDYLRALNLAPDHVGAQNNLAMTYLTQHKKLKEAERLAKAALRQKGPLQPFVLDTLAKIYEAESRYAEARAAAAQAATARGGALTPTPANL
ncbi:MAG: tetratricopeptide repeat protein [Elusimicrobiota bacterium]